MPPRGKGGRGSQQLVAKVAELKAVQQPRGKGGRGGQQLVAKVAELKAVQQPRGKGGRGGNGKRKHSIGISPSATLTHEPAPPKKQKVLAFQTNAEQLNSASDAEGRQEPEITHDAPASNAEAQQEPETTRAICSGKSFAALGHGATDAGDDNSTDKNGDTAAPDIACFDSETPTLAWGGGGSGAKQCSCDIM
jgi:hypothetical protein